MLPPPLLGADELTKCPKNLSRISCSDLADTAILAQKASKTRKQIQTNPLFSSLTHTLPIADKTKKMDLKLVPQLVGLEKSGPETLP